MQINRHQNLSLKPAVGAIFIRAPPATRAGNQPQSMWVWPGMQLVGAGGKKCLKGLFYTVEGVDEDGVVLNTWAAVTPRMCEKPALVVRFDICEWPGLNAKRPASPRH